MKSPLSNVLDLITRWRELGRLQGNRRTRGSLNQARVYYECATALEMAITALEKVQSSSVRNAMEITEGDQ